MYTLETKRVYSWAQRLGLYQESPLCNLKAGRKDQQCFLSEDEEQGESVTGPFAGAESTAGAGCTEGVCAGKATAVKMENKELTQGPSHSVLFQVHAHRTGRHTAIKFSARIILFGVTQAPIAGVSIVWFLPALHCKPFVQSLDQWFSACGIHPPTGSHFR